MKFRVKRCISLAVVVGVARFAVVLAGDPPPSHNLAFVVAPGTTVAMKTIPAIQVGVYDGQGNLLTNATNAITISIGTNPAYGRLSGTLTVMPQSGVATFSDLSIDKAGMGYTLKASTPALPTTTSGTFTNQPDVLMFNWVRGVVTAGSISAASASASLPDGGIATAGTYNGAITFGSGEPTQTTLTPSGVFVARYNPDGSLAWAKNGGGGNVSYISPGEVGVGISAFQDGELAITTNLTIANGSTTLGVGEPGQVTFQNEQGVLVAKFHSDGTLAWAKLANAAIDPNYPPPGLNGNGDGTGVIALPDGGVVATGRFWGSLIFGNGEPHQTTLVSPAGAYGYRLSSFLARYDSDGELVWAKQTTDVGENVPFYDYFNNTLTMGTALALLPDGKIGVTGHFNIQAIFGGKGANQTTLNPTTYYGETFLAVYNADGALAWATDFPAGGNSNFPCGLAADAQGNLIVVGTFAATTTFGPGSAGTLTPLGGSDMFVVKYDESGHFVWAKQTGAAQGYAVAVLQDGSILATCCSGSVTFGSGEVNQTSLPGGTSLANYYPDGTLAWAKTACTLQQSFSAEQTTGPSPNGALSYCGALGTVATFGPGDPNETTLAYPAAPGSQPVSCAFTVSYVRK